MVISHRHPVMHNSAEEPPGEQESLSHDRGSDLAENSGQWYYYCLNVGGGPGAGGRPLCHVTNNRTLVSLAHPLSRGAGVCLVASLSGTALILDMLD